MKKGPKMVRMVAKVPESLAQRMDQEKLDTGRTLSAIQHRAIEEYFERKDTRRIQGASA